MGPTDFESRVDQVIGRISESFSDFLDFSIPLCGVFSGASLNCQEIKETT